MAKNVPFTSLSNLLKQNGLGGHFSKGYKKGYLSKGEIKTTFNFLDLVQSWEEIAGKNLAKYTMPLKIKHKSLIILSGHPTFSQELSFLEEQIKLKIYQKYPSIKPLFTRIYFQTNLEFFHQQKNATSLQKTTKVKTFHRFNPHHKQERSKALKLFDYIEDEEVKENLISIYLQSKLKS